MSTVKHTPGPWDWFESMPGRPYLATPSRGRLYVMGFERKGMQGATPVFARWQGIDEGAERERLGGVMCDGVHLKDGRMHPDARLIAAAPELLEALLELASAGAEAWGEDRPCVREARAAIAKATGTTTEETPSRELGDTWIGGV